MPSRGSGQFGPDVLIGSKEYWRLWREKNKEKMSLAQRKYRLKQRELILAAELAAGKSYSSGDAVNVEEALKEITEREKALVVLRREEVAKGVIAPRGTNPLVIQNAEKWSLPFDSAQEIMNENPYTEWDEIARRVKEGQLTISEDHTGEFTEEMAERLKELGIKEID